MGKHVPIYHHRKHAIDYYVLVEGKITRKDKWDGVWHREGDQVFIRCVGCGTILEIDWEDISEEGFAYPCIVCGGVDRKKGCGAHLFIKFEGFWDKS